MHAMFPQRKTIKHNSEKYKEQNGDMYPIEEQENPILNDDVNCPRI